MVSIIPWQGVSDFLLDNKQIRQEAFSLAYLCTKTQFDDMDDPIQLFFVIERLGRDILQHSATLGKTCLSPNITGELYPKEAFVESASLVRFSGF